MQVAIEGGDAEPPVRPLNPATVARMWAIRALDRNAQLDSATGVLRTIGPAMLTKKSDCTVGFDTGQA